MPAGNVKTTSEWSTVLSPKVRLRLAVWWQGKYRSSIFKQNFWNDKETYFCSVPSLISSPPPPPPPQGNMHIQDGMTLQENLYDVCGMYYISTDSCTFISFPQHHLPHINLCGIISFSVMLGVCPVLPQSWQSPWGARGPQRRAQGAQIVSGILYIYMFANIWPIFALIIYKGHMKTLSSRCVLVLMALFIWLCN